MLKINVATIEQHLGRSESICRFLSLSNSSDTSTLVPPTKPMQDIALTTRLIHNSSLPARSRYRRNQPNLLLEESAYDDDDIDIVIGTSGGLSRPFPAAPAHPTTIETTDANYSSIPSREDSNEDSTRIQWQAVFCSLNVLLGLVLLGLVTYDFLPNSALMGVHTHQFQNSTTEDRSVGAPANASGVVDGFRVPKRIGLKLANVSDGFRNQDVPLFLEVPMSGGGVLRELLVSCLGLVHASNLGVAASQNFKNGARHNNKQLFDVSSDELRVVTFGGKSLVAIDTDAEGVGVEQAIAKKLIASESADVIVAHGLYETLPLLREVRRGQLFTMLRHPIDRAVGMYHMHRKHAPDIDEIMTLEAYAKSHYVENNWLTRILTNRFGGALTDADLDLAKEILRQKCLIGIFSEFRKSFHGFEQYFGWPEQDNTQCQDELLRRVDNMTYTVEEESEAWALLSQQNKFDMKLYEYGLELFRNP